VQAIDDASINGDEISLTATDVKHAEAVLENVQFGRSEDQEDHHVALLKPATVPQ